MTDRPVHVVPHVTPVPPPADGRERAAMLRALGLGEEARLVLYVFDGSSFLLRKNPDALVRAFAASGLSGQGWSLVLKTKHLSAGGRQGQALAALAHATPGVLLIDDALPPRAMSALFEAADVYASPHRSEGFGLTIAEAMAAGKTVVATDYGGSRDFLDAATGLPVPARRAPSPRTEGPYLKGWTWGEPDEAALATALRTAAERLAEGDDSLGRAARRRIAAQLSPDAVARAMRAALEPMIAAAPERAA
jgi:glycosyltransferase involved in cell wall biosynthesis